MGIEEDDAGWMAVEREPLLVESRSWSEQPVCINGSDQDAPATINTGCNPSNTDENSPLINGNEPLADTRFHVYLASLAFLILFVAYNSLQNYATSLLPNDLGNESLAILYITVPIFCFMGPPIIRRLGEKWTMVLGSSTYAFFMATLIKVRFQRLHRPTSTNILYFLIRKNKRLNNKQTDILGNITK